mmetsp:Transcript_14405/g.30258  ORF Transcript_14405/g.30258 Transcript_14405/m.30258 type:complete len:114 (-) Transcript_14405:918-1259(-)
MALTANLMAHLCLLGIYVFPGVSNTMSITQETDRKYGLLKTKFRVNLSECCSDCLLCGKQLNFPSWMVGMFLFGGMDPETGMGTYVDAFAIAFTKAKCLAAWEAVGAHQLMLV